MDATYRCLAVVPDPTAAEQPALARAAWLARASDAQVHLLGCDYEEHLAGTRFGDSADLETARRMLIETRREWLESLAAPLRESGIPVHCHASFDSPLHEAISRLAESVEPRPDLLIKDTHYHGPLKRSLFSNTDWELIRLCDFDLLLVKPREWTPPVRILAAVDPLHESDDAARLDHEILRHATALTGLADAQLHAVHVCPQPMPPPVPGFTGPAIPDVAELARNIERAHRRAVDALLTNYEISALHIDVGRPPQRLLEFCEELEADIMIVGAVSRSGLRRRFIGHTARHLLDRLPCDLLIVRLPT